MIAFFLFFSEFFPVFYPILRPNNLQFPEHVPPASLVLQMPCSLPGTFDHFQYIWLQLTKYPTIKSLNNKELKLVCSAAQQCQEHSFCFLSPSLPFFLFPPYSPRLSDPLSWAFFPPFHSTIFLLTFSLRLNTPSPFPSSRWQNSCHSSRHRNSYNSIQRHSKKDFIFSTLFSWRRKTFLRSPCTQKNFPQISLARKVLKTSQE